MAISQVINVIVNSKGAVTVARELNAIGDSAKSTSTYLNGLRGVLAAALTFSGAGQIVETINSFTQMQNKLKQVADATTNVSDTWERLLGIANSSYATIDNTVDLYFRVAQAYKAWGESAEKAAAFTDLFQKAATLSGSSVQTTSQAVYQFGQALNKGKLDGDEFRSVLEGLPYVANLIQKSLGVTRAELYKMSKDGKISVERIKEAFESAAGSIQKDWGNITPTIGQALNVLSNSWTKFVGDIQTSTGIFSVFAGVILLIANNFGLFVLALSPVAASLAFLAGRAGLGLVVTGFRDMKKALEEATIVQWLFNVAVSANPYVLAAIAIAAVVAGILYFTGALSGLGPIVTTVWGYITGFFSALFGYIGTALAFVGNLIASFVQWTGIWSALSAIASATMSVISSFLTSVGTETSALIGYLMQAFAPLFAGLVGMVQSFYNLVKEIIKLFAEVFAPEIKALKDIFKLTWDYIQPALTKTKDILSDIYQGWQNISTFLKDNFLPAVRAVFEGWLFILQKVVDAVNAIITALRIAIILYQQYSSMGGGGGTPGGAHNGAQFMAGDKGFATGGSFKVGGTNAGRDTTPVAFRAERGERVTVETKRQQRMADNSNGATSVNVPVNITNVMDPNMVTQVMESHNGGRTLINVLKSNSSEVKSILGIGG